MPCAPPGAQATRPVNPAVSRRSRRTYEHPVLAHAVPPVSDALRFLYFGHCATIRYHYYAMILASWSRRSGVRGKLLCNTLVTARARCDAPVTLSRRLREESWTVGGGVCGSGCKGRSKMSWHTYNRAAEARERMVRSEQNLTYAGQKRVNGSLLGRWLCTSDRPRNIGGESHG